MNQTIKQAVPASAFLGLFGLALYLNDTGNPIEAGGLSAEESSAATAST